MNDPDEIERLLDDLNWPVALRDIFSGDVTVTSRVFGPDENPDYEAEWDAPCA